MAKKVIKKNKPAKAKKAAKPVKKVVKKAVAKKPAKAVKKVAKKVSKPVAKKAAKKTVKAVKKVAKKVVKKAVAKKPVAKKTIAKKIVKIVKPVAKQKAVAAKPIKVVKPVVQAKTVTPVVAKKTPIVKPVAKKKEESLDDDNDSSGREMRTAAPAQQFFYEPPKAFINRPDLKQPKPFIGKDTRTRYSDKELKEFKAIIISKLEEAKRDYELLTSTLSHKDDHGTDDTSPTFKLLEDGSDVMNKEETAALASRQQKYIQNLQNALVRIENKSYGICRVTGKLIPKERLRSVPHATLSIDAKIEQYQ